VCDCAVALGPATSRGTTIFGKNSDRERDEPQPIRLLGAAEHPPGGGVGCTYIEIPQVRETAAVLGSGPFWVWGFEQGVNEHGVVIGNESVFTREELELPERGLLGMDLVRLGLERARSAGEALMVMTALIESFGQGGKGFLHKDLPYSNGFLIADANEAWSLQTSSRNWAAKRIRALESLSNHPSIGSNWDQISANAARHAVERGWWPETRERLNFESAFRSTRLLCRAFSDGRLRRSRALLEKQAGQLDERDFFRLLRDHGEGGTPPGGTDLQDESYYTLCAHNDVQQDTTASMVVALDRPVRWFALAAPCSSVYLPLYLEGQLPEALHWAGPKPTEGSAWWHFKRLQRAVEEDFGERLRAVRGAFEPLEEEWLGCPEEPDDPSGRMEEALARALELVDRLLARFGAS
jgi:dipeptidase